MRLSNASSLTLCLVLLGFLITTPVEASEKECPSKTECKAACGPLSETLTCSRNGSRCTMGCGGRKEKAECWSGSGTQCVTYCESGTIAATCSKRGARCTGRCTPAPGGRAFFLNDQLVPPALASQPLASLSPHRAHHRSQPNAPKRPSEETLAAIFSGLVADVSWSLGDSDSGSGSPSPSSLAEELLATLRADREFVRTGEYEGALAGDQVTIKLGLPAEDLNRMLLAAEELVRTFQDPAARRRYDAEVG